jgi:hypothetical protein
MDFPSENIDPPQMIRLVVPYRTLGKVGIRSQNDFNTSPFAPSPLETTLFSSMTSAEPEEPYVHLLNNMFSIFI